MDYDIPVALFVFRKLDTVKLILDVLKKVKPRYFYIFGDAARHDKPDEIRAVQVIREYIKENVDWDCELHLEYAEKNLSCSPNVRRGFNQVLSEHDYGIFLEDDAVPKLEFFQFCKELLEKYKNNNRIHYIAGFNCIGDTDIIKNSYCFSTCAPMSGAIATWSDRWLNVDWAAEGWPELKKNKEFNKTQLYFEYKRNTYKAFTSIFKSTTGEWDIQFAYDQYKNKRYAVVPKGNLVKNYICAEGAFHIQTDYTSRVLQSYMEYTCRPFLFPMDEPEEIVWNKEYDKKRQWVFLNVNGSYIQRRIKDIKISCKNILYKILPQRIWQFIKQILQRLKESK